MNGIRRDVMLAWLLGMALPWMVLRVFTAMSPPEFKSVVPQEDPIVSGFSIRVIMEDGTQQGMDLEDYLTGVVLAELPASFSLDAKKAQAVAARTFAWKAATTGGKHGDGTVCVNAACCQAYLTPEAYSGSEEGYQQAISAVRETAGMVLTYEGELIDATYFSCSGGSTEDAVAVWGQDVPYLRATESPGEENAAHYTDTLSISREKFCMALGIHPDGNPGEWFGGISYTAGGGVSTMEIGGQIFSGTELRALLNLKSTAFTIQPQGDTFLITTRGYGHRVGMSQYGANAMAEQGASWQEILSYYYRGAQLQSIGEN